jgi:hypothetical protein
MRCCSALLVLASVPIPALAQVTDVGLTLVGTLTGSTNMSGQICGTVTCGPLPGGTMAPGGGAVVFHHAAPDTPFALAIGLPGPCTQVPGIANDLMLSMPPVTVAVGIANGVGNPACQQGLMRLLLILPGNAPSGVVFRLQSLGVSNSGAPAFRPAIEVTIR